MVLSYGNARIGDIPEGPVVKYVRRQH
jgi:hypothetical protein